MSMLVALYHQSEWCVWAMMLKRELGPTAGAVRQPSWSCAVLYTEELRDNTRNKGGSSMGGKQSLPSANVSHDEVVRCMEHAHKVVHEVDCGQCGYRIGKGASRRIAFDHVSVWSSSLSRGEQIEGLPQEKDAANYSEAKGCIKAQGVVLIHKTTLKCIVHQVQSMRLARGWVGARDEGGSCVTAARSARASALLDKSSIAIAITISHPSSPTSLPHHPHHPYLHNCWVICYWYLVFVSLLPSPCESYTS
jgi:hypothetical protein